MSILNQTKSLSKDQTEHQIHHIQLFTYSIGCIICYFWFYMDAENVNLNHFQNSSFYTSSEISRTMTKGKNTIVKLWQIIQVNDRTDLTAIHDSAHNSQIHNQ